MFENAGTMDTTHEAAGVLRLLPVFYLAVEYLRRCMSLCTRTGILCISVLCVGRVTVRRRHALPVAVLDIAVWVQGLCFYSIKIPNIDSMLTCTRRPSFLMVCMILFGPYQSAASHAKISDQTLIRALNPRLD